MPNKYLVELHDGRKFQVEADQPPTEAEVLQHLGLSQGTPKETPQAAVARLASERDADAESKEFSVGNVVGGAWKNLNPLAAIQGLATAARHPIETGKNLVNAQLAQGAKAAEDFKAGRYSEMLGHGAAAALPLIGPAAANAGDSIRAGIDSGDMGKVSEGLGEGAGLVGSIVAPGLAAKAVKKVGSVLPKAAERIIESNVKPGALKTKNPTVNIPREILDQWFGPSERGVVKAGKRVDALGQELSAAVDNASQGGTVKGSLQPMLDHLDELERTFQHQPNATADLAAVQKAREALMGNPLYSKEVVVSPATPGITAQQAAAGTPYFGPQPAATKRVLIDQPLPELDVMKKNVYAGLKGKFEREGNGPVEVDKALGRGLKEELNNKVPAQNGFRAAHDINADQSRTIVARNALKQMEKREASKYPIGLMDMVAMGHGGFAAPAAVLALKHPSTAFPIARGIDVLGKAAQHPWMPPTVIGGGIAAGVGNQVDNTDQLSPETARFLEQYLRQR